jgi:fatty acid desaturase
MVLGAQNLLNGRGRGLAMTRVAPVERDAADARRYLHATLGWTLAIYALLGAALAGLLPAVLLVPAVPLIYVRLSLALHELLHLRAAARVPAFHRLAMIFDTPFGLGYREHRALHLRHHRSGADRTDPELFQIAGGHFGAFASSLAAPERSLLVWIRTRGISAPLAWEASLRLVAFALVAALNPIVFLLYWVVLRASIGAAGFVFHHVLHNRGGRLGTFSLPVSEGLLRAGYLLFGAEPMLILARHRAHHLWPELRVRELPDLPRTFELPPGPVTPAVRTAARDLAGGIGRE